MTKLASILLLFLYPNPAMTILKLIVLMLLMYYVHLENIY